MKILILDLDGFFFLFYVKSTVNYLLPWMGLLTGCLMSVHTFHFTKFHLILTPQKGKAPVADDVGWHCTYASD